MGYQVPGSKAHSIQKNPPVLPPVGIAGGNMGKQLPADQHFTGSSVSDLGNMHQGESTVSLPANVEQDLRKGQSGSSTRTTFQKKLPAVSNSKYHFLVAFCVSYLIFINMIDCKNSCKLKHIELLLMYYTSCA